MKRVPPIMGTALDITAAAVEPFRVVGYTPRQTLIRFMRLVRLAPGSRVGKVRIVKEEKNGRRTGTN